jgi:hypothetical protein
LYKTESSCPLKKVGFPFFDFFRRSNQNTMGKSSKAGTNNIVTGFSIFATLAYKDEPRLHLKKIQISPLPPES